MVFPCCTSIRPLKDQTITKVKLSEQLNIEEDRVWIIKKDGEGYRNLTIDSIEDTYLLCHNNEADILIIPYSSIDRIEQYYFSVVKTLALVVGIPVGLYTLNTMKR